MKKLFALLISALLLSALCVTAFAAEETEIPLVLENGAVSASVVTFDENGVSADNISLFSIKLPEKTSGTVTVHIKGSSVGDFRVWLLGAPSTQATASNQYKMSDYGFETGEFEKYIELNFTDFDGSGVTEADTVAFKGPS